MKKGRLALLVRGKSLREVAQELNLTEQYVSAILSGRVTPSEQTLRKLEEVLGMSKEEIFSEVKTY